MRVLLTNARLESWYGSELYLLDVARWLRDQGHKPIAYSARLGRFAQAIRREGIAVVDDLAEVDEPPDLIHAHHHLATLTALTAFPGVPAVAFCHGWAPWEEAPVVHPQIRRYVAVSGLTRSRLLSAGVAAERVKVIPNFVDINRFQPRLDLPQHPGTALVFSNHARPGDSWVEQLRAACSQRGISLDVIGESAGNPVQRPETILAAYDLVFARGRAALEAMATGAAVVVCDVEGLACFVTPSALDELREGNFGLQVLIRRNEPDLLAAEIDRYDRDLAWQASQIVRSTLSRDLVLPRLLEVYHEAIAESTEEPVSAREAGRATAAHLRSLDAMAPVPREELHRQVTGAREELHRQVTGARDELAAVTHEYNTFRSRFLVRRLLPALWRMRKRLAPTGSRRFRAYLRARSLGRALVEPMSAVGSESATSALAAEAASTYPQDASLAAVVMDVGGQPGLVAAVRSLVAQQPRPEIVVVSSGWGSAEQQLRDAGLEVDIVQTQTHLLPGAARNVGIAATHSSNVAFLEADCVAAPGWVAVRLAAHAAGARIVSSAVVNDAPRNPFAVAAHTLLFSPRLPRTPRRTASPAVKRADPVNRRPLRLVALLQFRNESRYLPGFLDNVSAQVDAIIALDDGSTDSSAEIMRRHPCVIEFIRVAQHGEHVWDEPRNRAILVDAAIRHGAEWVVGVDADERPENDFRQRAEELIRRADQDGTAAYSIAIRELWGSPSTYRVDGIWGRKRHARLFRLPAHYDSSAMALHGPWAPDGARRSDGEFEPADLIFYHLAMIDPADREARKLKYKRLDPDSRWQSIGYDYLTDETGIKLERVPDERGFRVTIPS